MGREYDKELNELRVQVDLFTIRKSIVPRLG